MIVLPPSLSLLRWSGHDRVNDHYGVCAMLERYGVHRRVLLRKLVIAIAAEWISLGKPCVSHSHSCLAWDTCTSLLWPMYSCVTVHVTAGTAASLVDRSADTVGCALEELACLCAALCVFVLAWGAVSLPFAGPPRPSVALGAGSFTLILASHM